MNETHRRRNGCLIGCGVIALVLIAAVAVGGYLLYGSFKDGFIERKEYDAVKVGDAETDVRHRLPDGKSFLLTDLDKEAPAVPAGASCLHLGSLESGGSSDAMVAYRFCFRDGTLVEKNRYEVKG
ncbi:hypothetical protein [Kitasatospora sp. NPDC093806]|uniref:hypothetical protein n=1 Tax=Kitasatospora sp. NPDC093806 TaxID=3155075 RepID=UPI003412E5E7